MPFLLARLERVLDSNRREIFYRGATHVDEVSEDVASLGEGEIVLLAGQAPPWYRAEPVVPLPWPSLEHPRALWTTKERSLEIVVVDALVSYGAWHVDPRGVPCEVGIGRRSAGVKRLLNYAGWRIDDFPRTPVRVWEVSSSIGTIWIVPPDSVPVPGEKGDIAAPVMLGRNPTRGLLASRFDLEPEPPKPFDKQVPFRNMRFAEGHVVLHLDRRYEIAMDSSRAMYNAVRSDLQVEHPAGLRVVGELRPDGRHVLAIPELEAIFRKLEFDASIAEALRNHCWVDSAKVARRRTGVDQPDLDELLAEPALGLTSRIEAFRLLFSIRDPSRSVQILPGRDVVIPVAHGGGPCWYVWEKVEPNHATYLFRPGDEETRERMLAWIGLQQVGKRAAMLADRALQRSLGFKKRVIHTGAESDLAGWWRDVCGALGRKRRAR